MKKIFLLIIIFLLALFGVNVGLNAAESVKDNKQVLPISSPREATSDENTESEAVEVSIPQTLRIPKINVETSVEAAGLDEQRKPILPRDSDNVVWYNLGPKPGEVGTSVMAGHWDKETGAPAVFYDLSKLNTGDEIIAVDENNKEYKFEVTKKVDYPFDKVPLQEIYAGKTDVPILNLITCGGTWNAATKLYSHRTVVYSQLVK